MIEYTIVAGFLGSGKTSLITDLLERTTERVAVIVNDLGDLGFDAELIRQASGNDGVIELDNGCICCSIGDSLALTLRELAQRLPAPEHIVVECSGAADPGRVARYGSRRVLAAPAVITVVDATDVLTRRADPRFAGLVAAQLDAADLLVVSKSDLVPAERTDEVVSWLQSRSAGQPVIVGPPGEIGAVVAGSGRRDPTEGSPALAVEHWELSAPIDLAELGRRLEAVAAVRAKGVVHTSSGTVSVQWAAGRLDTRPWDRAAVPSRITVIR